MMSVNKTNQEHDESSFEKFERNEVGYRREDFDTKIDYTKARHLAYSKAKVNETIERGTYRKKLITPKMFPMECAKCPDGWTTYSALDEFGNYGFVTDANGMLVLDWANCEGYPRCSLFDKNGIEHRKIDERSWSNGESNFGENGALTILGDEFDIDPTVFGIDDEGWLGYARYIEQEEDEWMRYLKEQESIDVAEESLTKLDKEVANPDARLVGDDVKSDKKSPDKDRG